MTNPSNSFYALRSHVEFIKVPESGFTVVSAVTNVESLLQCFMLWTNYFLHSDSKPWAFTYDRAGQSCVIGRSFQYDINPGVGEIEAFVYRGEIMGGIFSTMGRVGFANFETHCASVS